jgi:16S rRNA (cytosine1402-N4)-methyltransferase
VSHLLAHLSEQRLARLLEDNADEPHARLIAALVKAQPVATTRELAHCVREGFTSAQPRAAKEDVDESIRRTFQ